MESSLDRVLFATELEFPKILLLRLPKNVQEKQNNYILSCDNPPGVLKPLFCCSHVNVFSMIMRSANCAIHGCYSSRTTPGVSQYWSITKGTTFLQLLLVLHTRILVNLHTTRLFNILPVLFLQYA